MAEEDYAMTRPLMDALAEGAMERRRKAMAMNNLPSDVRDRLGKAVRDEWVACVLIEQKRDGRKVKAEHLIPWEQLTEREKEIDRRIGERCYYVAHAIIAMNLLREMGGLADTSEDDKVTITLGVAHDT